jgi:hypothetical protein
MLISDVEHQRGIAGRAHNPDTFVFPTGSGDTSCAFNCTDTDDQRALDDAATRCPEYTATGSPDHGTFYTQLARLMPTLELVPAVHSPDSAEFVWSRARCLFAGGGQANHRAVSEILTDLYPLCPLTLTETSAEWGAHLAAAHQSCGWPATLSHLSWADVCALKQTPREYAPESWHRVLAMVHILKHIRLCPDGSISVLYRGTPHRIKPSDASNVLGTWPNVQLILTALGCPSAQDKKSHHPLTAAVKQILNRMPTSNLLALRPMADSAATIISGPWSTLKPDPNTRQAFYQTGLQLDGVWISAGGQVRATTGDANDITAFDWNTLNPGVYASQREDLSVILPKSYVPGWPADTFLTAFPNLDLAHITDLAAAKVWLELPWFASLIRGECKDFRREYPLVAFLPDIPSPDTSTNQGKTMAAHAYGRIMVPAIPTVGAPDTGSAPDARALAAVIQQYGTVVLDEWVPPRARAHLLAHANLQMLITGSTVSIGRVMENSGGVTLKHSMAVAAKALDFPPDMVNRSLFWFMREFTTVDTQEHLRVQRLTSGSLSMEMRLQAIGTMEQYQIARRYMSAQRVKLGSFRFDDHACLARILYELRTGRPENGELALALRQMRSRFTSHWDSAETSGVATMLEDGGMTRVHLTAVFYGMDAIQLDLVDIKLANLRNQSHRPLGNQWNTVSELLNVVREVRCKPDLQSLMPSISGSRSRPSDRTIILALSNDIRVLVPENGTFAVPETPYQICRSAKISNAMPIRFEKAPRP